MTQSRIEMRWALSTNAEQHALLPSCPIHLLLCVLLPLRASKQSHSRPTPTREQAHQRFNNTKAPPSDRVNQDKAIKSAIHMQACSCGDAPLVRTLLVARANANQADTNGVTVLMHTCAKGFEQVACLTRLACRVISCPLRDLI